MIIETAIQAYCDAATADYVKSYGEDTRGQSNYTVYPKYTTKYVKLIMSSYGSESVFGFVVNKLDGVDKFKFGDILKAANWAAPAKNFARGSVFDPKSYANVKWTGAA